MAQLQESARALALAEPEDPDASTKPAPSSSSGESPAKSPSSSSQPDAPAPFTPTAGTSLAEATGEIFYRTKAAAVWWMLRSIVGDQDLKLSLQAYRNDPKLDRDPEGFEQTLEKITHKDLHWFFNDWVYRDRGLPDLTIVNVTPSQLDSRNGQSAGWLVAVEIRNDGYAQAEVPVTVRSATSTETHMLRIPGRSSASTRIIFPGTPEQVEVNDGGVPETRTSIHTRQLVLPGRNSLNTCPNVGYGRRKRGISESSHAAHNQNGSRDQAPPRSGSSRTCSSPQVNDRSSAARDKRFSPGSLTVFSSPHRHSRRTTPPCGGLPSGCTSLLLLRRRRGTRSRRRWRRGRGLGAGDTSPGFCCVEERGVLGEFEFDGLRARPVRRL